MYAPLHGQQAAHYFNNYQYNGGPGRSSSSSGSWETAYSADDGSLTCSRSDSFPGKGEGSPMGHFHASGRAYSAPPPRMALPDMASLTVDDGPAYIQAAFAEQQFLGWAGQPLHNQNYIQQASQMPQQHQRQHHQPGRTMPDEQRADEYPQQRRRSLDDLSGPKSNQHTAKGNNSNGYAPAPRGQRPNQHPGSHSGAGPRSRHHHPNAAQSHPQSQHQGQRGHTGDGRAKGHGYRRLWQQVTAVGRGGRLGEGDSPYGEMTVEDLLEVVRRLPPDASAVKAVAHGLHHLDSGALAALLKELNKAGHGRRAQEVFDWLRGLDPGHDLYPLCNTMTYTTMISQCGSQQALRRALELVAEMRGRGVQCNVHTYSALMNVCIKANELDLAQDVYRQMLAEGCTPNLVTYNTLIDVHGKTGAWEEAILVLDTLEAAGIQPEVRTYNTVIIACNQSNRAAEALHVYERMLATGAQPTATTYTALISAYGKAGQLDAALQIFQDMVRRGCERNVITYSSLISACEKGGRWELALELFREMHTEGCRPNVVTYNSLIAACAQGAQWERAQDLFEAMQAKGCRPDSVTFGGLIAAYDRAGHWRRALQAFEQMRSLNCRPDSVVFNTVVGALWRTGLVWAQARAAQIFHAACRQGHFRLSVHSVDATAAAASGLCSRSGSGPTSPGPAAALVRMDNSASGEAFRSGSNTPELVAGGCRTPSPAECCSPLSLDGVASQYSGELAIGASPAEVSTGGACVIEFGVHAFTVGSAALSLLRWVCELRDRLPRDAARPDLPQTVALVLNKGKPSREHTYPAIKAALVSMLSACRSPFLLTEIPQGCRIEAGVAHVGEWLRTPQADALLSSFQSRAESPHGSLHRDAFFQEDARVESRCAEAFVAVRRFEAAYPVRPGPPQSSNEGEEGAAAAAAEEGEDAARHRHLEWFRTAASVAAAFNLSDEVLHDAFLLADRAAGAAAAGGDTLEVSPTALAVACLAISAQQAGEPTAALLPTDAAAQRLTGLGPGEVDSAVVAVRAVLHSDTSSISALRVLKLYLERLGAEFGGGAEGLTPVAGAAMELLPRAVCAPALRRAHPSLVAAAVLLAGRRAAGVTPFWPHALLVLTGLSSEGEGSELQAAAEVAYAQAQAQSA